MKEPERFASVIDLSDRRPTPKELPAFVESGPAGVEDSGEGALLAAMRPFHDELLLAEARLLDRLIELTLPELRRLSPPSIRQAVHKLRGMPAKSLRELEARLGTFPERFRSASWLDEPARPLARDFSVRGEDEARPDDTGVISGRAL